MNATTERDVRGGEAGVGTPGEEGAGRRRRADGGVSAVPPAWTTVLRRQLRLLRRKRRRELLLLGLALAAVAFLRLSEAFQPQGLTFEAFFVTTPIAALVGLLALVWPAGVWYGEGPGDRGYHWSLPVARPVHDLTRVGVGAFWLFVVLILGFLTGLAVGWLVWGYAPGVPSGEVLAATFLSLLLSYLLGSVPALVSEHPLRWILGVFVGASVFRMAAEGLALWKPSLEVLADGAAALWGPPYGLEAALSAPRHLVLLPQAPRTEPWAALFLWLVIALAAVLVVANLHVERAKGVAE